MIRRIVLILIAAASSGCFDFDAAYAQYCDGGRCTDAGTATGGGAATGGGGGGAVTGGGGGTTGGGGGTTGGGGGVTGGGGGVTGGGGGATGGGGGVTGGGGGTTDAGCPQFLCPELDWTSPQSGEGFNYFSMAPGLNLQSLDRFNVYASFQTASFVRHYEFRFVGGTPSTIFRSNFPGSRDARTLRGISLSDQWFNYNGAAQHVVGSGTAVSVSGCSLSDGGLTSPSHHNVLPLSADEAWLIGYPMSVCRWTSDGGVVQTADVKPNFYMLDAYQAPSGKFYVAGGDYTTSNGVCVVTDELGALYGAANVVDDYYTDGCNSIDGKGEDVFVVARDDSAGHGKILRLQPDGGFDAVYTANFRLNRLDVLPSGQVWAVGAAGPSAIYFDGGAWAEVTLPLTENRFNVDWENVAGTDEGIVLTGSEWLPDGGYAAVVNAYRFFGK